MMALYLSHSSPLLTLYACKRNLKAGVNGRRAVPYLSMNQYQLLALLSSLNLVALELTLRALQRERDQGWFLSLLGSLVGGIILLPFIPFASLDLAPITIALLGVTGIAWAVSILAEFKSHSSLEVGVGALIASSRAILLVMIGAMLFGETLTLYDSIGAALAIAGVMIACPLHHGPHLKGLGLRLVAVAASTVAIAAEKYLAQRTAIELVIVGGYLIPAAVYLMLRPGNWREQCTLGPPRRRLLIFLYTIFYTLIGPTLVVAFALGNLGETFIISQSRLVLIMLLGALLLHERRHLLRRCVATMITLVGLYLLVE